MVFQALHFCDCSLFVRVSILKHIPTRLLGLRESVVYSVRLEKKNRDDAKHKSVHEKTKRGDAVQAEQRAKAVRAQRKESEAAKKAGKFERAM